MLSSWIEQLVVWITGLAPAGSPWEFPFMVRGLIAVVLVGFVCGSVGSLVVGNRMAFFSDALAHCAFAGVSLGLLLGLVSGAAPDEVSAWITPVMVCFGAVMGLLIALVREKTSQASDTVIGVFFAGAIGLGAIFLKTGASRRYFPPENFLFGDLITLTSPDLADLFVLLILTCIALVLVYNRLVFASFNPSLAKSRGIRVRLYNYAFIILLALIVNICLKTVGVLLINALLIVPAAAAANLCRNMRQLFACSVTLCILSGIVGKIVCWELHNNATLRKMEFTPGESGTIVLISVLAYFCSIFASPWLRSRKTAVPIEEGLKS